MTIKKRWIAYLAGLVGIGVASFAVALPAPTACLTIGAYGLELDAERFFVPESSSGAERKMYKSLVLQARERIEKTFGRPQADPVLVFFTDPRTFWPLHLNLYGQAPTVGERACLIIGPNGQNLDVVAHELMHAEMHHRLGSWTMLRQVPAWFDEGVAMQVDYRKRYDMNREQLSDSSFVRQLNGYQEFSLGQDSYAAAKREVGDWLAAAGPARLYERLERLRSGEAFSDVVEQPGEFKRSEARREH